MAKISVLVAAYNVGAYIGPCLESVIAQTHTDWEAIVVNDASTDNTQAIIESYAAQDSRIILVNHSQNKGLHLARKTGVERCSGQYAFFLDGDDDLSPEFLQGLSDAMEARPVDVLHFGLTVVGENDILADECHAFEQFNNTPVPDTSGEDIIKDIYEAARGNRVDWRVTQRMYRTDLLKQGFEAMTAQRLERAEDGYECFVLSALAQTYRACKNVQGYKYHYGRGVTGTNMITAEKYGRFCQQFSDCLESAKAFAETFDGFDLADSYEGFRRKALELLSNDWAVRLAEQDKEDAAARMAMVFGRAVTAREIWRLVCDAAWRRLIQPSDGAAPADLKAWSALAQQIMGAPEAESLREDATADVCRCEAKRRRALELLGWLDKRISLDDYQESPAHIYVSVNAHVKRFKSSVLIPAQAGAAQAGFRFPEALQDDCGENLSDQAFHYGDLCLQYWAWKNDSSEYVGFFKQDKYLSFSADQQGKRSIEGNLVAQINEHSQEWLGLSDNAIASFVKGADLVSARYRDKAIFPERVENSREAWLRSPVLRNIDLTTMMNLVERNHPRYAPDIEAALKGNTAHMTPLFVMSKKHFDAYCQWLFPLLEEFIEISDWTYHAGIAQGSPQYLANYLFEIYHAHMRRIGTPLEERDAPIVYFDSNDLRERRVSVEIMPENVDKPLIPVVFATDEAYFPMTMVATYSLLKNADPHYHYAIVMLVRGISWDQVGVAESFLKKQFSNFSFTIYDMNPLVEEHSLVGSDTSRVEMYYRFLLQDILPSYDKALFLDSDVIVRGDISQLYQVDLGENYLAAASDIVFLSKLNQPTSSRMSYSRENLKMADPYSYFQTGVSVLNIRLFREVRASRDWLEMVRNPGFRFGDQDVLNLVCQGKTTHLGYEWNVVSNYTKDAENLLSFAPAEDLDAYQRARQNPQIIHYAGPKKPWSLGDCDYSDDFWAYAKETPFFEKLLHAHYVAPADGAATGHLLSQGSPLRRLADPLLPEGSGRRELAYKIARKLTGR